MAVIIIQALGVVTFLAGSIWLGLRVRRISAARAAERASRISHALYWGCLLGPGLVGLWHPGLTHYDQLLGIAPLPLRPVALAAGIPLLAVGLGCMVAANRALVKIGRGAPAFLLTEQLVSQGIYGRTRNPMSLGYYAACVGVGLIAGSTTVTCGALFLIVPAHVFNLRYFEERELELRHGDAYRAYRRRVAFLLPRFGRGKTTGTIGQPSA
jgi:protein-S-isoprenylcysteine O-methyltransferase Ste14